MAETERCQVRRCSSGQRHAPSTGRRCSDTEDPHERALSFPVAAVRKTHAVRGATSRLLRGTRHDLDHPS